MKKGILLFALVLIYSTALIGIGYFIPRTSFLTNFVLFSLCFISFFFIYHYFQKSYFSIRWGIGIAFFFRLILFGAIPSLSDDFYRFVWDGQLLWQGINPYLFKPMEVLNLNLLVHPDFFKELLEQMNSPGYYSVYTPLNQLFFFLASGLAGQNLFLNVIWIKFFLLFFECINFLLLFKILSLLKMPSHHLLLYALNPLVILEVIGNVHFEGMVLTGLLGSVYFFLRTKPIWSGYFWAWAVAIKLNPLMLGPLYLKEWMGRKRILFFTVVTVLLFIFFLPLFFNHHYFRFWESLNLYQGKFEFNASIFYVLREMGVLWLGYNPIATLSPLLNAITFILILGIVFRSNSPVGISFIELMIKIYLIFLLFQPVVHPWYLIPGLGLSVLTEKKSFLAWSGLVFLSYHAYAHPEYEENTWILIIEYFVLFMFVISEYFPNLLSLQKVNPHEKA